VSGDDRVWQEILRKVNDAKQAHVKVGVLSDGDHDGIGMIELAAIHEFGSPAAGIPERSFIRRTFIEKESELAEICARLSKAVIAGSMTTAKALDLLGAWGASEVKKTVTAGPHIPPPLKEATIAAKGSDRPLVDTGRLIGSVTWEVEE
jgi:hypothetical protein